MIALISVVADAIVSCHREHRRLEIEGFEHNSNVCVDLMFNRCLDRGEVP
jgi:hypothetical protein